VGRYESESTAGDVLSSLPWMCHISDCVMCADDATHVGWLSCAGDGTVVQVWDCNGTPGEHYVDGFAVAAPAARWSIRQCQLIATRL